jgi:glycosyltransferase involved in cell wall biosynthesis
MIKAHLATAILRERKGTDAVVTGRYGELFAIFQALVPYGRKPHILMDIEWPNKHSGVPRRLLSTAVHRLIARGVYRMQVFCNGEGDNYSSYFGIDRDKFVWIPYCTDLDDRAFQVEENEYIFTGGLQHRDYETLFYAVRDLTVPIWVAAPKEKIDSRFVSENMRLLGVLSRHEFFSTMARSKLVVLSLEPGPMRFPGVITYVTAMRLGKCVIVNETTGTKDYIANGKTGIVVREKDPLALKNAITSLLADDDLRNEISRNAHIYAAEHFSIARYISDLNALIQGSLEDTRQPGRQVEER